MREFTGDSASSERERERQEKRYRKSGNLGSSLGPVVFQLCDLREVSQPL